MQLLQPAFIKNGGPILRKRTKSCKMYNPRESRTAWMFIAPYLIGYSLFHFLPLILSFLMSFTNLKYISKLDNVRFIGFANYLELFTDDMFKLSLGHSVLFTIVFVPLILILGLALAVVVNRKIYARNLIRGMVFMPYVSNMVAVAVVWSILLDPISGPINMLLKSFGIENVPMWLMSSKSALVTVVLIAVWQGVGLQFITYLAALQGVPVELKEAASMDGANGWQIFRNVTLPCIAPTTFLLTITSIINSLKNFTIIQVLTAGGPGTSTSVLPLNIVNTAFSTMRMGYASAQAMVLFAIVMIITAVQWKMQERFAD